MTDSNSGPTRKPVDLPPDADLSSLVTLTPKSKLSEIEAEHITARVTSPEHRNDEAINGWDYQNGVYAIHDSSTREFIGVIEASGRPEFFPGWWIDSNQRGKGYLRAAFVRALPRTTRIADGKKRFGCTAPASGD